MRIVLNRSAKIGLGLLVGLLILSGNSAAAGSFNALKSRLSLFIVSWEGFRSAPYWDSKQWSWGYATRVPGSINNPGVNPGGSISRSQAMTDLLAHAANDYLYLLPLIDVPLSAGKWTALLSFSYNLGTGNADNLVNNINSGDREALETQWKKYIYVDGEISDHAINRRSAEWSLWVNS